MTIFTKHLVLGFNNPGKSPHQNPPFPGQVGINLILEGGREEVTRTNGDTQCQGAVKRPSCEILEDSKTGVNTMAGQEIGAHTGPRSLGSHQDHIDMSGRNNPRLLLVHHRETMREIKGIPFVQTRLELGPDQPLCGIRHQILDDGTPAGRLFHREKGLPRNKTVTYRLVPVLFELRRLPDDHPEPLVTHVQGLRRPLYPVSDDRNHLIFQYFPCFLHRELLAENHVLHFPAKTDFCHNNLFYNYLFDNFH